MDLLGFGKWVLSKVNKRISQVMLFNVGGHKLVKGEVPVVPCIMEGLDPISAMIIHEK